MHKKFIGYNTSILSAGLVEIRNGEGSQKGQQIGRVLPVATEGSKSEENGQVSK